MTDDPIYDLGRKVRFPPMMGGNREMVTVPCTLLGRLLGIAAIQKVTATDEAVVREIEWLEMEIIGVLANGVQITRRAKP